MLRIYTSSVSRDAKGYFDSELSKGDYYTEYQQVAGRWGGKASGLLGLVGDVDKEGFHALCDNLHPVTKKKLTQRNKANRRVGYDISFHCPKSVSLLFQHSQDEAIVSAFRQAVSETMSEMEREVKTRTSVGLNKTYPVTGNMAWAEFIHLTSRPVGGGVPDPHLHAHCFTFNTTYDISEKRWKAAEFSGIYHDAPYYQAAFQARLAKGLKNLGYNITKTEYAFEIAGIPKSLIKKFSKRTSEIDKMAEQRGITSDKEKDKLGAFTRNRKNLEYTKNELHTEWKKQFSSEESEAVQSVAAGKGKVHKSEITAKASVDHAVGHVFERASVMDHKRLLAEALHHGVGDVDVSDILAEGKRAEILTREINGNLLSTTREVLAEEKAMTGFARESLNTSTQIVPDTETIIDAELNEEQRTAINHIWRSNNQVMGVIGGAGVGKTRLMTECIRGIKDNGHKVFTFAPSASAARDVLVAEGFDADTVARLLIDEKLQEQVKGQVIWIDEAGLLGVRDMNKLFKIAKAQNARVILSGDSKQHAPVARGDALRILEKQAGIEFPEIRKIQRQKSEVYRDAVYDLSRDNVDKAFDRLESINAIIECRDNETRNTALAEEYLASIKAKESTLIISPTHAEGEAVTRAVRNLLLQNGLLKSERGFVALDNTQWTEAEKADPKNYHAGMIIEFHQNAGDVESGSFEDETEEDKDADYYFIKQDDKFELHLKPDIGFGGFIAGFKRRKTRTTRSRIIKGDRLYVLAAEKDKIKAINERGDILHLPTELSARFHVYRSRRMQIAVGEKLLLTKNGTSKNDIRHYNGDLVQVKSFTRKGDIELTNGKILSKDHGHFRHGYCTTSYAAQGKTVDKVLIAQSAASVHASSTQQFYVSVSRGKQDVQVFTDNKEILRDMVKMSSARSSAQELVEMPVSKKDTPPDIKTPPATKGSNKKEPVFVKENNVERAVANNSVERRIADKEKVSAQEPVRAITNSKEKPAVKTTVMNPVQEKDENKTVSPKNSATVRESINASIGIAKKMVKIFTDSKETLRNVMKQASPKNVDKPIISKQVAVKERIAERAIAISRVANMARAYASAAIANTGSKAKVVTNAVADKTRTWVEKVSNRPQTEKILPKNFPKQLTQKNTPGGKDVPRNI